MLRYMQSSRKTPSNVWKMHEGWAIKFLLWNFACIIIFTLKSFYLGGVVENIDTLTVDHYVIVATIDYE